MAGKSNIQSASTFIDTLSDRLDTLRTGVRPGLMELLGKPLYDILESGEVKSDMPFGFKGKFDLYDSKLGFSKKFGKDYKFEFDLNKRGPSGFKDDYRVTFKKEF